MKLNTPIDKKILWVMPLLTFVIIFLMSVYLGGDPGAGGGLGYAVAFVFASIATIIVSILIAILSAIK